jgi:bifunctional DNA-binding transcriptional regulator/antitoxin component of YhaV-PrlF toxin-antitoxin module
MASEAEAKRTVRPLRDGRITIPVEFRRVLGITEESLLDIAVEEDAIRIRKVEVARTNGQGTWLAGSGDPFVSARAELATRGVPADEIDAAIDAARRELRRALLDRLHQERREQGGGTPWRQLAGIFRDDPSAAQDAKPQAIHILNDDGTVDANQWFKDLYDYFAPAREEIITRGIGEEEVNADTDAALHEVRNRRT